MNIVRWSPLQEFDALERRTRRLLDEFGLVSAIVPAADVYETEGEYVYELEVPGFEEKELAIEVTDHTLVVKGTRTVEKEERKRSFHLHERLAKEFERRFELPLEADTETLSARFANGVLELHAPKVRTIEPRKIKIAAS